MVTADICVLVPVLGRPQRAAPLVESLMEASTVPVRLVFLCTMNDYEQIDAAKATGADVDVVPFDLDGGDYARKINHGIASTDEPWVLQAGDDLKFHRGWDTEALARDTGQHVGVIGTNDLGNPLVRSGRHSTHSLIRRAYIEEFGTVDEPGKALHEGYWHCWVDNELVETAKHRNAYAAATRSHVEHLHHIWPAKGGGRKGVDDATYQRGQVHYVEDHRLFRKRRPLWQRGIRVIP